MTIIIEMLLIVILVLVFFRRENDFYHFQTFDISPITNNRAELYAIDNFISLLAVI